MKLILLLVAVSFAALVVVPAQAKRNATYPVLRATGIGSVPVGAPKARAVAALQRLLGPPNATFASPGCGRRFTEVAWRDLVVEFREGQFSGYRFAEGGWPHSGQQSPDRVTSKKPTPPLSTASGITLGSTVGELRHAYGALRMTGAVQWTASNDLNFVESSTVRNTRLPDNRIVEIHTKTCGTDF
jgi:hypothetical protein